MSFPKTNWDLIRQLDSDEEEVRSLALGQTVLIYSAPLRAFARVEFRGRPPEDHDEMLQSFFMRCWKNDSLAKADEGEGAFRNYLATAFKRFGKNWVRDEKAKKRLPPGGMISEDELRELYGDILEARDGEGGEGPFQRVYLHQALEYALNAFKQACIEGQRPQRYEAFVAFFVEPCKSKAGKRPDIGTLAERYNRPQDSMQRMLHSAYKEFRGIALAYLAQDHGMGGDPVGDWSLLSSTLLMS